MSVNLFGLLEHRARHAPQAEAFVDGTSRLTFSEAVKKVERLAAVLLREGVGPGDRVGICCKNSVDMACVVFAVARAGAIGVFINWRLTTAEIDYVLIDSGARLVIHDDAFNDKIGATSLAPGLTFALSRLMTLLDSAKVEMGGIPAIGPESPAVIMYTSGTTGKPKGVVLSHANLTWTGQANLASADWQSDDRYLVVAPLFHIGGFAGFMANILVGCTSILMGDFSPAGVWKTVKDERITSMMTVPAMLAAILASLDDDPTVDTSTLRSVICGASAVPATLIEAYRQRALTVRQVYGATESGGAVTFWSPKNGAGRAGSQGRPVFFAEVRIVDPATMQDVEQGSPGEVWCRSPMVFIGYWNNPEATAEVMQDDWYRTGDVGIIDEDGALYIVDRLKDLIISGGENLYPAEIESAIGTLPGVAEVAVVGRADARWGEVPVAFVVRKQGAEVSRDVVLAWCKDHLGSFKCVKDVIFVDALPRNGVGKVLKRSLREHSAIAVA